MLINEFKSKDNRDPDKTAEYLSLIFKNSLPGILQSAPKKYRNV